MDGQLRDIDCNDNNKGNNDRDSNGGISINNYNDSVNMILNNEGKEL